MKKKISAVLAISIIASNSMPAINVFADEVIKEKVVAIEKQIAKNMQVGEFKLKGYNEFSEYNKKYQVKAKSIENNGGSYNNNSKLEKAIDGQLNTYWETSRPNTDTFKNHVVVELEEVSDINRIAYATRQDGAIKKGYPVDATIYVSESGEDKDFVLAGSVTGSPVTGGMVEFKFDTVRAKKVKFVFDKAHDNYASASEFWFYKEDKVLESMERLFTDENMNKVSDEFASKASLDKLEADAKAHPFYETFKDAISDARVLLEENKATYTDAKVSKFKKFGSEELVEYDKTYKLPKESIVNISTNGSHWEKSTIDKAIDGNIETNWHSNARNNANHKNEVIMTLDEIQTIDKVVYTNNRSRGFAKKFDIYVSKTLSGNTFTKVTSGASEITQDSIAIKFNPTEARRVKFVFTEAYEDWAVASEFGLYKPDTTLDKMERLFTDSNMNKVSAEFDTIEELKALEEECQKHPLYNDFKEDLANAKAIIENVKKESTVATTKKFLHVENKEYLEEFRMPYENIKRVTNNGGAYMGQNISNIVDGKLNTYWETNTHNTDSWKNEITVEFEEPVTLDRIAYGARQTDRRGFIESFEIYGSTTTKGNTFELVSTAKANTTAGLVEAKFEPTKFQRLKIKVIKSGQNWPTLNELMFFKEDTVANKVEGLFTNGLMNELKPEFNSKEALEALEKEVQTHPLKDSLMDSIELAKKVLNGEANKETSRTLVAEQRGNYSKEGAKRSINGAAYTSLEPFGKYVTPGEEITVYVDADPNSPMPKLCFGQVGKGQGDWRRWADLHPGKNVIKAPTNMNSAAVYLVNEYTPEEQAYAPRVRFDGGTSYPIYRHGETTPEEFNKQLEEYVSKVEYNDDAFKSGNPDGKVFNIAELVSENCVITTSAKGALEGVKWAASKGYDVGDTMDGWEEMRDLFQSFMGFDENATEEKHTPFPNKFIARVFLGVPLGYADHGYTGYLGYGDTLRNEGFFKMIVAPPQMPGNDNWAYNHEFGHIFNTAGIVHGEVTNNLYAQEYRRLHPGTGGDRANWDGILKRFKGEKVNLGYFESLAVLSQLNIAYGYDAYAKAPTAVRDNKELINSIKGSELRRLAVAYSLGLGVNLLDFFEGWGYTDVTPEMREVVKDLPKPDKKIEYLHSGAYDYEGNGFSEDVEVTVSSNTNKVNKTTTLKFGIDNNNSADLLGYEILKDGEVIGYTKDNSFVVKDVNINENAKYDVVAYAKDLSTASPVSIKAFQPNIETVGGVTLELNEKFNPLDYVKASDYEGNELTDIKVTNNVDNTKIGNYTVIYEVTSNNVTTSKKMKVNVVNEYDYLSDSKWKSVQTEYGNPSRNNSIKGRTLGKVKNYDKGIRLHANGNVVYDLGEHNYDNFEVKVGVDMNLQAQGSSSITFKVVGDGETLATTKVLKHADNMQYINVPVKGVKELRLEVNNGGNGNESDHGIFVEPKLTTNNAKSNLTIPKSQTVEVGKTLDNLEGEFKAIDAEDGDITENVTVTGQDKVNFDRVGKYTITYSVTDKDGNKTEKSRVISVVHPEDFNYLSDSNWKSASSGWRQAVKDKAVGGGKLKLTGSDKKEVVYDKGIGTHAHSEIVYDLKGKDVSKFSSFIGVDRSMINGPSSIEFKVYVDSELAYESGVMRARDPQKFVEVDLVGADELKLVVTTSGDGDGSDHANWADAKLHFVNEDRVYTKDLETALEEAKKLNAEEYTDASYEVLAKSIAKAEALLKEEQPSQDAVDSMTTELKESIKALVDINLDEVVNVPDEYLVKALNKALGKEGNLTIGDMRTLEHLDVGYGVVSLEGLQHAKNLKSITGESNEVKDLRPLSKLEKLTEVNFRNQYVSVGELKVTNGVIKVNTEAYNRQGKNVATKVVVMDKTGKTLKEQDLDGTTKEVDLDVRDMQSGFYSVHVTFEDAELSGTLLYMVRI